MGRLGREPLKVGGFVSLPNWAGISSGLPFLTWGLFSSIWYEVLR